MFHQKIRLKPKRVVFRGAQQLFRSLSPRLQFLSVSIYLRMLVLNNLSFLVYYFFFLLKNEGKWNIIFLVINAPIR